MAFLAEMTGYRYHEEYHANSKAGTQSIHLLQSWNGTLLVGQTSILGHLVILTVLRH